MNNKRRDMLRDAIQKLNGVIMIVDNVCDKEQDSMDNMPENLQSTEQYETMEDAVESLMSAVEQLDEAKGSIESALK